MGKKTNTTKPEAPAKRALTTKRVAEKAPPAKPAVEIAPPAKPGAGKAPATKPAAVKGKPSTGAAKPAVSPKKKPAFSQDDIALRAYYIAERRQAGGIHADPHQDWVEAERQLSYEAGTKAGTTAKPKAKKAKA